MRRVKPGEQRPHPFIEPGTLAKNAIRAIGREILAAASTDLKECAQNVKLFAAEAKIDLFTLLQASSHPGVQEIGERQLQLAAAWASYTAQNLAYSSAAYIRV